MVVTHWLYSDWFQTTKGFSYDGYPTVCIDQFSTYSHKAVYSVGMATNWSFFYMNNSTKSYHI